MIRPGLRLTLMLSSALALLFLPGRAQVRDATPATPPPSASQAPGTGTVSGIVIVDGTNTPVRRAAVTLRDLQRSVSTRLQTDENGRFLLTRLPASRFTLAADKAAYIGASYGSKTPNGVGVSIVLTDGQQLNGITVKIYRGAAVSGRVVDEFGRAPQGARVSAVQQIVVNGVPTVRPVSGFGTTVDDRGYYRLFGLAPGTYVVSASGSASTTARMATPAEIQWAMRGRSGVAGTTQSEPVPSPTLRFVATYYPGTADPSAAARITLVAGEERGGLDFVSARVPASTVSGVISRQDGLPSTSVQVVALPEGPTGVEIFDLSPFRNIVSPQGAFSISGLAPGRYVITARASSGAQSAVAPAARGRGAPPPVPDLWASQAVAVSGADVTGVRLSLAPGMSLSGRVVLEAMTTPQTADVTAARVGLSLPPGSPGFGVPSTSVDATGAFKFSGLAPGSYRLVATMPGGTALNPAWVLKSVIVDGQDALDSLLDVRPGSDLNDVVITFSDQVTRVSGTLTDQTGQPAPAYFVIVFSTDKNEWGKTPARRVRTPVRPATNGSYVINTLPPGRYYLAALVEYDPSDWNAPEFLQAIAATAIKFTLTEGEKKVQDFRLAQ